MAEENEAEGGLEATGAGPDAVALGAAMARASGAVDRELIAYLSRGITLQPGDLITTGTPQGVGFARKPPIFLKGGDQVTVEIDGIGSLSNPVKGN